MGKKNVCYDTPQVEVIEIEVEQAVLQVSGGGGFGDLKEGEDL